MIPLLLLVIPLLACLLIAIGFPAKRTAVLMAVLNFTLALVMSFHFQPQGERWQFETIIPWFSYKDFFSLQFHIAVDGINLAFILLTSIVSLVAISVSSEKIHRAREFFICLLLISFGSLGAFLSLDLFFFYLFHEIALIPTFLLLAVWGFHENKMTAWQMVFYLAAGSLVLLAGILAFYFVMPNDVRTLNFALVEQQHLYRSVSLESQIFVFVLMLIGFGVLAALWPFHNWAPRSYASSPAALTIFHAGILKNIAIYGLLRIAVPFLPQAMDYFSNALLVLLLMNILYIGFTALAQKHLDYLMGYFSVMHMGFLFLGLICFNSISITGVILLAVAYGLTSALLFGLTGEIRQHIPSLAFCQMGGFASKAPRLTFLFIAGALASIGLPGFASFAGEILVFFGAWKIHPVPVVLALFGILLSTIFMLRAVRHIFFGQPVEIKDIPNQWPYLLLIFTLLLIGLCPSLITQWIKPFLKYYL